ncbi:ATP-binding cassette domain-containing protein [Allorhodopirellula solitaria]|uniref:Multidrug resistance ABC transporter ATP-binding and permease protein n=1 Tax=Allorhodopirellula solitaria TaxID=2527987 RepID=A0A5C5XU16_9BACT|nr:ABC transporter ATP-binding protein [Allorhodopirellula solitaria]TWT66051.1 Multidrug resistance ABC transporter ATP-binding and permease protein [Allorhodopirellula solitaria]
MNRFATLEQPRRETAAAGAVFHWFWAIVAGLAVPVLIVLFGMVAVLIDDGEFPPGDREAVQQGLTGSHVELGTYLSVPLSQSFQDQTAFAQLLELVALCVLVAGILCVAIWINRRSSDRRTRSVIKSLHQRVLQQSLRRSETEGAAAQRSRAVHLIGEDLPNLGVGLSLWYRVIPRSALILIGCVVLALLVNVWLAILAVISGAALWWLYAFLRSTDWLELSQFEISQIRERLIGQIGDAPIMGRLQAGGLAEQTYEAELESLMRRLANEDARQGRLWPLLMFACSIAVAVLVMGLGANILHGEQGLSLPASLVLGMALTAAALSSARLGELARQLKISSHAAESVYLYLQRSEDIAPSERLVGIAGLRESVELRDVSLADATGKPILQDLSLSLRPKSLVALLGTESVSTQSLAELLMGFGRPQRGVVELDGVSLNDIHPQALAKQVMWVAPDGPLWEGTITENLMSGVSKSVDKRDMVKVLEELGIYEQITRLSDGIDSMVGPVTDLRDGRSSDGLSMMSRYMLGIARALLHRPAIVLVKEPPAPTEHVNSDPCLNALRSLADSGSLVLVLPRRLQTLRHADRVVLLNGSNLVGEGKHAELLNSSDLYRHLNYLLFNPYRHRAGA